jgi:hypothetical protein
MVEATLPDDLAAVEHSDLRETSFHPVRLFACGFLFSFRGECAGECDNYGFALAAQPGWSQGRPDNNTSSQLIVNSAGPLA